MCTTNTTTTFNYSLTGDLLALFSKISRRWHPDNYNRWGGKTIHRLLLLCGSTVPLFRSFCGRWLNDQKSNLQPHNHKSRVVITTQPIHLDCDFKKTNYYWENRFLPWRVVEEKTGKGREGNAYAAQIFGSGKGPQVLRTLFLFLLLSDFQFSKTLSTHNRS